jgi:hypothetical protein
MGDSGLSVDGWAHVFHGSKRNTDMSTRKTFDVGRDSGSGKFVTVKEAEARPNTTTVARIPKSGYGDTKGEPSRRK